MPLSIFKVVPEGARRRLAQIFVPMSFRRREVIWKTGQRVDAAYWVVDGLLACELHGKGQDDLLMSALPRNCLAIAGLANVCEAPTTLKALTTCRVLKGSTASLIECADAYPEVHRVIMNHLVERMYFQSYLSALGLRAPVEKRLAYAIWAMSKVDAAGRRVKDKGVSQGDIAKYIGSSREEVSRKLAVLQSTGYLEKEGDDLLLSGHFHLLFFAEGDVPGFVRKSLPS